ncbi:metallophosphoesterase family protein [Alsobacter sp. SYSU BS001988]
MSERTQTLVPDTRTTLYAIERRSLLAPLKIRIYAVGDVHGRADLLKEKFAAIDRFESSNPVRRPFEVYLGDYIDKGAWSREVLELLISRERARLNVICLRGNHEQSLLDFLDGTGSLSEWEDIGGRQTLKSYGIAGSFAETEGGVRRKLRSCLPAAHQNFLRRSGTLFRCGCFVFVHAGVRPGIPIDLQSTDDLLWIREPFLTSYKDELPIVVHGHSIVERPDLRPSRINIDTGAYATGRLTCLVLDHEIIRFI